MMKIEPDDTTASCDGYIAFVLHAHLPYVRHLDDEHALEHRWLFEAITESYIPLLKEFQALQRDDIPFRLTLSISPTLAAMLADPWLQTLYERHLRQLLDLAKQEMKRTADDPELGPLTVHYYNHFVGLLAFYSDCDRDLLSVFRELQDGGCLELITCGATHAFLPLVQTRAAMRAQIAVAVAAHERLFGQAPRGFWLPECGYTPGVDELLREYGIDYFFVGQTAVAGAVPQPLFGTYSPLLTTGGLAAFAGDNETARQVWSSSTGYPGDPDYREYYRDIGFDLDLDRIGPYIHPEGIRVSTGMKYYRVTGAGDHKETYRPDWAAGKTSSHAEHFVALCARKLAEAKVAMGRQPLIVTPFDAELFGHWWYEGPQWLGKVLRGLHEQAGLQTLTPSQYLKLYEDYPVSELALSTWGRDGYAGVWLNESNDWIYPALHTAERRMQELSEKTSDGQALVVRAVTQAARELMLAQASDWAFIMDGRTTVDYAVRRTKKHVQLFTGLYEMIVAGVIDESWLTELEVADALFPSLDCGLYRDQSVAPRKGTDLLGGNSGHMSVLLLAWEYPPLMVGGLSRHVYDLSRFLVQAGCDVHVITIFGGEGPPREMMDGVHVYRVDVRKPDGGEFIHWTLAMNLAMLDLVEQLILHEGLRIDLVHAHDWMVGYAAGLLKEQFSLPLVATIHATEHGRNGGIFSDLQRQISAIEWQLTYDAQEVIVCSTYMLRELQTIFSLAVDKQHIIPNGVDPAVFGRAAELTMLRSDAHQADEAIIVFVGRLVREKGVQTLVEAAPAIMDACPQARIVVIGKGPMMTDLIAQTESMGVSNRVHFTGFVSDETRNDWLRRATVAVFPSLYEPFGIVALEAMAVHIPVVVADIGGLADVVTHGLNGRKSVPGDAASLAEQVIHMVQHPDDAKRYASVATAELTQYDWARIAEQTLAIYRRAIADGTAAETR